MVEAAQELTLICHPAWGQLPDPAPASSPRDPQCPPDGTHRKLRSTAPAKPSSRKKGREPRMEVMTIMAPLRRPGHVSMAAYGVAAAGTPPSYSQTLGHHAPLSGTGRGPLSGAYTW